MKKNKCIFKDPMRRNVNIPIKCKIFPVYRNKDPDFIQN